MSEYTIDIPDGPTVETDDRAFAMRALMASADIHANVADNLIGWADGEGGDV